jgi:hypothetical protein
MTATVTTLNAGSGGASVLVDSLTLVDGAAAPASAIAQMVKIGTGAAGAFNSVDAADPLACFDAMSPATTTTPAHNVSASPSRIVGLDQWACSFANVGASVLSADMITPIVGTGVTYNQTAGSLNILTGTTVNAEWLSRSTVSFKGAMRMRASIVASQRIANQNLQIVMADLVGAGLTYTLVSATVVNVTLTAHGFTAQNVGQFMNLGGITGVAGVPGRYAIAAIVDVNTIQFTVAGWPATGTGTLTLFGWNSVRNLVNGTVATNIAFDSQRKGWATGDTTATINTTATPGVIVENDLFGRDVYLQDSLRATATSPTFTTRASRYENIPDEDTPLYLWIWSYNGTVAPATTTTWTIGFVAVENFANLNVFLQGVKSQGTVNPMAVSGAVTASIAAAQTLATVTTVGTVSTITTLPALVAGTAAIGDVGLQLRANATGAATVSKFTAAATTNAASVKASAGRVVGWNLYNTTAAIKVFRFFNLAVAPTMGTSSPAFVVPIAPNSASSVSIPAGIAFTTGIAIACTGAIADLDTTVTAANDVVGEIFYA